VVEVARAYRSSATDLLEFAYSCDRCGKSLKVSVLTTSRAWTLAAPYGLDESEALRRAEAGAALGLPEEAKRLVSLLACPACRARGFEHNNLWTMSVLIGLGSGAVLSMMVWPLSELFGIHLPFLLYRGGRHWRAHRDLARTAQVSRGGTDGRMDRVRR
jgi:hypothetical protein